MLTFCCTTETQRTTTTIFTKRPIIFLINVPSLSSLTHQSVLQGSEKSSPPSSALTLLPSGHRQPLHLPGSVRLHRGVRGGVQRGHCVRSVSSPVMTSGYHGGCIFPGEYPGVIMTIVLKRKINYHLLQTYLPSGERPDLLVNSSMVITELDIVVYSSRQNYHCCCGGIRNIFILK